MGSLVAELAEKLSAATNSIDFDEQTLFLNTSANTVGIGTNAPASKLDVRGTVQVGIDDTGHDVKFFGATSGNYFSWDEDVNEVNMVGTIKIKEQADAHADTTAFGQIWVNTATPCELYFTTDAGNDIALTSGSAIVSGFDADGAVVFNESSADVDFRIESNGQTHMFFVDGGNDKIGIGTSAPASLFDVQGTVQVGGIPDAIGGFTPSLQVEGTGAPTSSMSLFRNSADTGGAILGLGSSRNASVGGDTIVQDNDTLGTIQFVAADGVDRASIAAEIKSLVGGTPGADDTPGELVFSTTADGAQAVTERMRIMADGKVGIGTSVPVTDLTIEGPITIKEQADADADTAAYGQIWVNTATPCQLYFTTDAGNDIALTSGSSIASSGGGGGDAVDCDADSFLYSRASTVLYNSGSVVDFDAQIKLGSNVTESGGEVTISTAGWWWIYYKITDHNNTLSQDLYLRVNNSYTNATRTYSEVNNVLEGGYYGEMMGRQIELSSSDVLEIYGTARVYGQASPHALSWFGGYRLGA